MCSGKTTELLRRLEVASVGKKCLYINSNIDSRDTTSSGLNVTSHNPLYSGIATKVQTVKCSKLMNVDVANFDVIGIDEAQFFGDLVVACHTFVDLMKKCVIVAGLNSDWRRQKFGHISELLCKADDITLLKACCVDCAVKGKYVAAPFTWKISPDTQRVDSGGCEKYTPLCRACYEYKTL